MMPASQGFAAILEATLAVSDELAHRLSIDVTFSVLAREAVWGMVSLFLQAFELGYGKL